MIPWGRSCVCFLCSFACFLSLSCTDLPHSSFLPPAYLVANFPGSRCSISFRKYPEWSTVSIVSTFHLFPFLPQLALSLRLFFIKYLMVIELRIWCWETLDKETKKVSVCKFLKITYPLCFFFLSQFSKVYDKGANHKFWGVSLWNICALEDTESCSLRRKAHLGSCWHRAHAHSSSQAHGEGSWRVPAAFSSCCSPATGDERWPWKKSSLYFERGHLNSTMNEAITPIMTLSNAPLSASHSPWLSSLLSFPSASKYHSSASNQLTSSLITAHALPHSWRFCSFYISIIWPFLPFLNAFDTTLTLRHTHTHTCTFSFIYSLEVQMWIGFIHITLISPFSFAYSLGVSWVKGR